METLEPETECDPEDTGAGVGVGVTAFGGPL